MSDAKVAVVTGAGREQGIGEAIALELARQGANVVVTDLCRERPDKPRERFGQWEELERIRQKVERLGVRCLAVACDVTDEASVENLVAETVKAFGTIDILCNNAGGGTGAGPVDNTHIVDLALADWNYTIGLSLTSVMLVTKHAARPMIAAGKGGAIVNTSSISADSQRAGTSAYSVAKLGVIGLTRCLAAELAPHKIRVNAFSPGVTRTQYLEQRLTTMAARTPGATNDDALALLAKNVPLGRAAGPEDMASVAAFLASDASSYMTGQVLGVDGGITLG